VTKVVENTANWQGPAERAPIDTWVWFQSGINTDGAHNWPTSRKIRRGDILSLNCFPMIAGYYTALERTLFFEEASERHLELWEINCEVYARGLELIKPEARCMDIAAELNEIYREHELLANRTFEKWTVPVTLVVLVAMSIVAWSSGDINWGYAGEATGADRWTAITQVMTAIGIGWGITWLPYASDYSRFVPRTMPRAKLFWAGALGQFIPVLWLGILGASIATTGTGADPAVIIVATFGALAVPVLFLVIHGPIATNILNVYSTSVAALAVDIKVPRHVLSVVVGVLATAFTLYLVFAGSLAENLDAWLAGVVAWVSPWGPLCSSIST
jgi:hypothetical protein